MCIYIPYTVCIYMYNHTYKLWYIRMYILYHIYIWYINISYIYICIYIYISIWYTYIYDTYVYIYMIYIYIYMYNFMCMYVYYHNCHNLDLFWLWRVYLYFLFHGASPATSKYKAAPFQFWCHANAASQRNSGAEGAIPWLPEICATPPCFAAMKKSM